MADAKPPSSSSPSKTASIDGSADLTLTIRGTEISGWTETRVTRSIERCPNDFDIAMTDLFIASAAAMVAQPGDPCTIALGKTKVITGYVNKVLPSYDEGMHSIRVTGRGKCQDLVDCSAEWPGGQISGATALEVAQKLAQPYNITVSAPGSPGPVIPQFNLNIGETAYEIIERICRYAGLLCYEDVDGNLVLAQAGTGKMGSDLVEGQNVLAARGEFSDDERFKEYDCFLMATDVLGDVGDGGNLLASATDGQVTRHRKHYIIADAGAGGMQLAQARANWEMNRRWGRGNQVIVTADSWRDGQGELWTPNKSVHVVTPNAKWARKNDPLIGTVSYTFDGDKGTRCEVACMPPEAFKPEPVLLQPEFPDITNPPNPDAPQ